MINKLILGLASVGVLALVAVLVGIVGPPSSQPAATNAGGTDTGYAVSLAAVEQRDLEQWLMYHGVLDPASQVHAVAEVPGRIKHLHVDVGDWVEADSVVVELEARELALQAAQAEAGMRAAEANLQRAVTGARLEEREQAAAALAAAEANYRHAENSYYRTKDLYREGAVSRSDWEAVEAQYEAARAQLRQAEQSQALVESGVTPEERLSLEAGLDQARAAFDLAELALERTAIKAPIGGRISAVHIEEGNMLGSGSLAVSIVDTTVTKLRLIVPAVDVVLLEEGQLVEAVVDAFPDQLAAGTVLWTAPAADPSTGLFPVSIEIPNPQQQLRPGMHVTAHVQVAQRMDALAVPERALVRDNGETIVYRLRHERVEAVPVETGLAEDGFIEIKSGLRLEDTVVVSGQNRLYDGALIRSETERRTD